MFTSHMIIVLILELINWSIRHFFKILYYAIITRISIWTFFFLKLISYIKIIYALAALRIFIILNLFLNWFCPLTHLIIIYNKPLVLYLLKIFNGSFTAWLQFLAHNFISFMQTLFITFVHIYMIILIYHILLLYDILA